MAIYGITNAYRIGITSMEQGIGMERELLNRNLYRQIKSMDKAELGRMLNNIYEMGKEDAMKGIEAVDIDLEKMRSEIGAAKGIVETRLNQIMGIISEHLNIKKSMMNKAGIIKGQYTLNVLSEQLFKVLLLY